MNNFDIFIGIITGLTISHISSFTTKVYNYIFKFEQERNLRLEAFMKDQNILFDKFVKTVNKQNLLSDSIINKKLSLVMAKLTGSSFTPTGTYKTSSGIYNSNNIDKLLKQKNLTVIYQDLLSMYGDNKKTEEYNERKNKIKLENVMVDEKKNATDLGIEDGLIK